MKKLMLFCLTLVMCVGLNGCGKEESKKEIKHKKSYEVIEILEKNGYVFLDRYDENNECSEVYFKNEKKGNAFALNEIIYEEYNEVFIFQFDSTDMILTDGETVIHGNDKYDNVYSKFEKELEKLDLLADDVYITLEEKMDYIIEQKEVENKVNDYIDQIDQNQTASKFKTSGYSYIYNIQDSIYNTSFEKKTKSDNNVDLTFYIYPKEYKFTISDGTQKIEYDYVNQLGYTGFCVLDFSNGQYDTMNADLKSKVECRSTAESMNYMKSVFEKEIGEIGVSIEELNNFANGY